MMKHTPAIKSANRIDEAFDTLHRDNKTALMPYMMAGYPDRELSLRLMQAVADAGADLIEFGIPYSDPMADGPTIQVAAEAALARGITTDDVFILIRQARDHTSIPIVIMTYYNTIYRYGLQRFAANAADAGADGVIIPDLPIEETGPWRKAAKLAGLATVMLVAPTSGVERIKRIVDASEGFVYCVSLAGVTGARTNLPPDLSDFIKRVRAGGNKPLAVGFGIATAEQAKAVADAADGVIIGSALVSAITRTKDNPDTCIDEVKAYISTIREAIDS